MAGDLIDVPCGGCGARAGSPCSLRAAWAPLGGICDRRSLDEAVLLAAADEANERIRTCHEVVACPRCRAPIGRRCVAMRGLGGGGYAELTMKLGVKPASTSFVAMGRELKHAHRERWTLVQAPR